MRIECTMCGRLFNKRKNSDDEIMQDVCKQCVSDMYFKDDYRDE